MDFVLMVSILLKFFVCSRGILSILILVFIVCLIVWVRLITYRGPPTPDGAPIRLCVVTAVAAVVTIVLRPGVRCDIINRP